jgi:dihydrofolate reductase
VISIIVAQAKNRIIGKANDLPWYLPADLRHFKELTTGHTVIMGRKTYESIVSRLGGPLPERINIVLTRGVGFLTPGAEIVNSIDEVLREVDQHKEVFIIGGASVYEQAMPYADKIYLTDVHADIDGDTYFPEINPEQWQETSREVHHADERNAYDYDFVVYERVK